MNERVICIDDSLDAGWHWPSNGKIIKGEVYTIYAHLKNPWGTNCVLLNEVGTSNTFPDGTPRGYYTSRFALTRDTSIEIFQAIDQDVFKKVTA